MMGLRRYRVWRPGVEDVESSEDVTVSDGQPRYAAEHYVRRVIDVGYSGVVHVAVRTLSSPDPDTTWNVRVQQITKVVAYPEDRRAEGAWAIEFRSGSFLESLDAEVGCPPEAAQRFHSQEEARAFIREHTWIGMNGGGPKRVEEDD